MMRFKKYLFPFVIGIICFGLFLFNTWLAWPGYISGDSTHSLLLSKINWHPVILSSLLQFLYWVGGPHVYYMLLFNLVPFYIGLFVFVWAVYKKYRTYWSFVLLFPVLIGNIFFQNFVLHSSSVSPMWIFLLYALAFYGVLNPIKGRLKIISFYGFSSIVFMMALLSRHNAIIQVFPIAALLGGQLGLTYSFSKRKYWVCFLIVTAVTLSVSVFVPRLLQGDKSYPAQHILLHQIAGACVPADDSSCFKEEWYQKGANWETARAEYLSHPFCADYFSRLRKQHHVFQAHKLEGLIKMWGRAIFRHPYFYMKHVLSFVKKIWLKPADAMSSKSIQTNRYYADKHLRRKNISFPNEEKHVLFTQEKEEIYEWLRTHLPFIPTLLAIGINLFCVMFSLFLLLKNKKDLCLWYTLCTSIGGIAGYILFSAFSPVDYYRYVYPPLVSVIVSVIGCLTFVYGYFLKSYKKKT